MIGSGAELRDITRENFTEALALTAGGDKEALVPPVAVSLAKVSIRPDGPAWRYRPLGIYRKSRLVGFLLLVTPESDSGTAWISGFLIDVRFQGHGLGRRALLALHDLLQEEHPGIDRLNLTVVENNEAAIALYRNTGFDFTGAVQDGELVMSVELR